METELKRTKDTNHILSERIKLFEEANDKDIFERYFPKDKNNLSDDGKPKSRSSCYTRPHHCCTYAPPPCIHHCNDIPQEKDLAVIMAEVSSKVTVLARDFSELRDEVRNHECASHIQRTPSNADTVLVTAPPPPDITGDVTAPHPPDITGDERGQTSPFASEGHDISVLSDANTIDDNVPNHTDLPAVPLNYPVLTTQLPQKQLGLTQNI